MGEACALAGAASGESATSEREDVPGDSFVFFEGEGLSTGPGERNLDFDGSSASRYPESVIAQDNDSKHCHTYATQ
jgi:hypothetical protein